MNNESKYLPRFLTPVIPVHHVFLRPTVMGQMTSSSPNSPSLHSSCWLLDGGEAAMAMCHGTRGTTDDIKLSDQTLVSLSQPEIINGKPFAYFKHIYIFETEKQLPTHTIFQSPIKPSVNELFNITVFQCNG